MNLKNNLKYKRTYAANSGDKPLVDFFIPVLKQSIRYDRIASYYSSSSLYAAAEGISGLILNGGSIRMIMNVVVEDQKDFEAIEKGSISTEDFIDKKILSDINALEEEILNDRWKVLSHLIKIDKFQIKVGVVPGNIEHSKIGVFYDESNNIISFTGSTNESKSGWTKQSNLINVFNNWNEVKKEYVHDHINIFEETWNNRGKITKVYDLSEAVKNSLFRKSHSKTLTDIDYKKLLDDIDEDDIRGDDHELVDQNDKRSLYFYQKRALVSWKKNNFVGLFEMATGSGKTFTSLKGIDYLKKHRLNKKLPLLTIIVVPYKHLVEQWFSECLLEGINSTKISGDQNNWRSEIKSISTNLKLKMQNDAVVITTYNTYRTEDFINQVNSQEFEKLIIADEVHNAGSISNRVGLHKDYEYRLGLSATPARHFDDYGTYIIEGYFKSINKPTFSFSLKQALEVGSLCSYLYNLNEVKLSSDELDQYMSYNKKIGILLKMDDEKSKDDLKKIYIQRSKVIMNAEHKYQILYEKIRSIDKIEHLLIYVSPQQIDRVMEMLNELAIRARKFTMEETTSERKKLIKYFEEGNCDVLVAMKCLDEGVDIPIVKRAIIMASSGNSREYIQRRGRVLRKHISKTYGEIDDFIVKRDVDYERITDPEKKIILKQFKRILNFAATANNENNIRSYVINLAAEYRISIPEEYYAA